MVTLFEHLNQEDAETFSLVLNAVGIGHRVIGSNNRFRIDVPEPLIEAALNAVHRYQSENSLAPPALSTRHSHPGSIPISGIFVALMLFAVYMAVATSVSPQDYNRVFGADARLILEGQLYRCATALVLHADATHIAANMVGVALFGSSVCAITGTGVGWLMIFGLRHLRQPDECLGLRAASFVRRCIHRHFRCDWNVVCDSDGGRHADRARDGGRSL